MDAGDTRKLGSFSGSTLTKKSMNFLRDAYSFAQTTFTDKADGPQQQSAGLSQHFGNAGSNTANYPHPVANPYLQPSSALSPHSPQQWRPPPPSPNRPQTQAPLAPPYLQSVPPHRPHQVGNYYVPGQGMVSQPWGHDGRDPQRHNSNASADAHANFAPPPPPYAPPQHCPSQAVTPDLDPPATSPPPRPSASPQPEQQGQWGNPPPPEQHQPISHQQHTYQAFFPAMQQSQQTHPVPQRHQTLPAGQYRPVQYQLHHSNSYPATGLSHQPSTSHSESPPPPLPSRPTPPLPQRPQWQAQQPPVGYAELPSPPPQQQPRPQPQHQQSYFAPPSGVAEMYAPPPLPPTPSAPVGYAELPVHEPPPKQQTSHPYQGDSKPPVYQYGRQQGGHHVPQMAELPG